MTQHAAFEEREYERPLYAELQVSNNRVWSPGQVLENRLGFDTAFFSSVPLPFHLNGALPPGVSLPRYWHFLRHELGVPPPRKMPGFLLNVFLQAKRPRHLSKAAKDIAANGVTGPHWAFELDDEQQLVLEKLEAKFAGKAVITYAAPAFHTERALYKHTIAGTVADNSTFPAPSALKGHKNWHYKVAGATGVAKSEAIPIAGLPLEGRLRALLADQSSDAQRETQRNNWVRDLQALSAGVGEVMADPALPESFRRAEFFSRTREIAAYAAAVEDAAPWLSPYLKLLAFLSLYRTAWLVVG